MFALTDSEANHFGNEVELSYEKHIVDRVNMKNMYLQQIIGGG